MGAFDVPLTRLMYRSPYSYYMSVDFRPQRSEHALGLHCGKMSGTLRKLGVVVLVVLVLLLSSRESPCACQAPIFPSGANTRYSSSVAAKRGAKHKYFKTSEEPEEFLYSRRFQNLGKQVDKELL